MWNPAKIQTREGIHLRARIVTLKQWLAWCTVVSPVMRMTLQIPPQCFAFYACLNGRTSYDNSIIILGPIFPKAALDTDQCGSQCLLYGAAHWKWTAGNLNWSSDRKYDCSQWLILSDLANSKVNFHLTIWKENVVGWWVGQMAQRKNLLLERNWYWFGSCY